MFNATNADLLGLLLSGSRRALARAATIIERGDSDSEQLLADLFPSTGRARIIGVTGPAGVGKSTLVNAYIRCLRAQSLSVAVIAIDPSSAVSAGALLGDRIRMLEHTGDQEVFIRSCAARGAVGGLASSTLDLALLLDAAGFDFVIIESVGVGQGEIDIVRLADVTLVVLAPGFGDGVQAIKAGIMEIADLFVVNKADQPGADGLVDDIKFMQGLANFDRQAPICRVVAADNAGVGEMATTIASLASAAHSPEKLEDRWEKTLAQMVKQRVLQSISLPDLSRHAVLVARRQETPYAAVAELMRSNTSLGDFS